MINFDLPIAGPSGDIVDGFVNRFQKDARKNSKSGQPRTARDIEKLILNLAKESAGLLSDSRELKKLALNPLTRNKLRQEHSQQYGFDIGPKSDPGTWDDSSNVTPPPCGM